MTEDRTKRTTWWRAAQNTLGRVVFSTLMLAMLAMPAAAQGEGGGSNAIIESINAIAQEGLPTLVVVLFLVSLVAYGLSAAFKNPQTCAEFRKWGLRAAFAAVFLYPAALFLETMIGLVPGGAQLGLDIAPYL